jgi:hypothetical protein
MYNSWHPHLGDVWSGVYLVPPSVGDVCADVCLVVPSIGGVCIVTPAISDKCTDVCLVSPSPSPPYLIKVSFRFVCRIIFLATFHTSRNLEIEIVVFED